MLERAVLESFGPTDLVAIMNPLTPTSAIELTRDRRALANRVRKLEGRLGVYIPPRNLVEEEHLRKVTRPEQVAIFRRQVTVTALKAAMAHLGTLREGRKTLVVITQGLTGSSAQPAISSFASGPPSAGSISTLGSDAATALDLVRMAKDSNTAVHVIDPGGLQVPRPAMGTILEMVAHGSGGEMHETNDAAVAFRRIIDQCSATYLLGYTRDLPVDGRFHEIKVRVKRGGVDVRARAGYWAPRAEDVERAKTSAAAAALPAPVAEALAALPPPTAPRLVDVWAGTFPLPGGRAQVTIAWTPRLHRSTASVPVDVGATVKSQDQQVFEGIIERGGTSFEVPPGPLEIALRVLAADGQILDREVRTVQLPDRDARLALDTPVLYLASTPGRLRAIRAPGLQPAIHAGREFVRTDRLLVRVGAYGAAASTAVVGPTARPPGRHARRAARPPNSRRPPVPGRRAAGVDRGW